MVAGHRRRPGDHPYEHAVALVAVLPVGLLGHDQRDARVGRVGRGRGQHVEGLLLGQRDEIRARRGRPGALDDALERTYGHVAGRRLGRFHVAGAAGAGLDSGAGGDRVAGVRGGRGEYAGGEAGVLGVDDAAGKPSGVAFEVSHAGAFLLVAGVGNCPCRGPSRTGRSLTARRRAIRRSAGRAVGGRGRGTVRASHPGAARTSPIRAAERSGGRRCPGAGPSGRRCR